MNELRRQILDCIRYLRRNRQAWLERDLVHVYLDNVIFDMNQPISHLIGIAGGQPPDNIFLDPPDDADFPYAKCYTKRKQTDYEYFEVLAQRVCPTEYQIDQYQNYLRLKNFFEGKSNV